MRTRTRRTQAATPLPGNVKHTPAPQSRRGPVRNGERVIEWSVRCTCGRYQSPWREDPAAADALWAAHRDKP